MTAIAERRLKEAKQHMAKVMKKIKHPDWIEREIYGDSWNMGETDIIVDYMFTLKGGRCGSIQVLSGSRKKSIKSLAEKLNHEIDLARTRYKKMFGEEDE